MTIQSKAEHEVTLAALNELKSILKRLGSFPEVNLKEIEKLREQILDLQAELALYELRHEDDSIKVDLVKHQGGWHYELKFGERHSNYIAHLTDPEVTRLIKMLQDRQRELFQSKGRPSDDDNPR